MRARRLLFALASVVLVAAMAWITRSSGWFGTDAGPRHQPTDVSGPVAVEPSLADLDRPLARIAAAGDAGTGGSAQAAVAAAMDSLEDDSEFDALLLLGDNVYPNGEPELIDRKLLGPFAGVLDGDTELTAALGNHDVRTGDGEPMIDVLGLPGRWFTRTYGPVRVVVVDSNRADDPDQAAFVERTLAEPTEAMWTVVIQHHPPYSAGAHGSHGTSRRVLVPLYARGGVDLVLAGHDHDYQRSTAIDGVTYVVSGGGGAGLRAVGEEDFTAVALSTHHFMDITAYADRLEVRAVDTEDEVIDEFVLRR